jgi:hypothetical protein
MKLSGKNWDEHRQRRIHYLEGMKDERIIKQILQYKTKGRRNGERELRMEWSEVKSEHAWMPTPWREEEGCGSDREIFKVLS